MTSTVVVNSSNISATERSELVIESKPSNLWGQFILSWVLFAVIMCGNAAVLEAMYLARNRKSRMNFFITQLAIADMTVALLNVLPDVLMRHTMDFYGSNALCKFVRFIMMVPIYGSTYVLLALSIDRYDAICRPMNFASSGLRAKVMIVLAWAFSCIFSLPSFFIFELRVISFPLGPNTIYNGPQCYNKLFDSDMYRLYAKPYMTLAAVTAFIVPAIVIMVCYTIIVCTIWSKSKSLTVQATSAGSMSLRSMRLKGSGNESANGKDDSRRASSRGLIPKAKIKTIKMTFVIVFAFIVCWSPYFVYDLLDVYGRIPPGANVDVGMIQILAPLNSAANPIIYCLFSTNICSNLRKIWLFNLIAEKFCFACCPTDEGIGRRSSTHTDYTTVGSEGDSVRISRSSGKNAAKSSLSYHNHEYKDDVAGKSDGPLIENDNVQSTL